MTTLELIKNGAALVFVFSGLFFLLLGSVGILRFPDFYSRLHPAGKADTLGASLLILGLAIQQGLSLLAVKLVIVQLFILLANPTAAHALGRAGWRAGIKPWRNEQGKAERKEPGTSEAKEGDE